MTVYLTRKEHFSAAHRLWVTEWSDEKNITNYGPCTNTYYHGHNYKLHVTVKGTPDPVSGMIVNAKDLGKIIKKRVIDVLDHTNLNMDRSFLPAGKQTTVENLSYYIWKELEDHVGDTCKLHCIRVEETDKISAEYYGE